MSDDNPMFRVRQLSVALPDFANKPPFGRPPLIRILNGLDFEIQAGSVLGVVGGSGSGKSTLGRTLVRLLKPSSGLIEFEGADIGQLDEEQMRPLRRRLQMIFQDPMSSLNPRRRVKEIIADPLRIHGLDRIDARVDEALDHVGLPRSFRQRYPHELSGGQRQRIGIARAIAMRPDFILADEIVSGLDVSSQAQVLNLLEDLVRELGLTVAFISHDLSVIRRLCSQVLVLNRGSIVEYSPVEELFAAPKSEYTRELLDSIPLPDPDQPGW